MVGLLPDLNWGKWNCEIDLRETQGRETLRGLIETADVVVLGYRPGVLDKFGFGEERILEICGDRERGLVLVEENCYGWKGEWLDRPGWQQISDAVSFPLPFSFFVSYIYGINWSGAWLTW